ncbi:MAG: TetR/AcrR family transcriptional regulator [Rhizobiaceae bacterium]
MSDLRAKILEAAVRVFMRYGVGRTRMTDIASEAGVVRQTLYSFFNSKDEILCGAIRHFSDQSLAEIRQEWRSLERFEDKLDVFYDRAIITSFAIITASPEARDMIGGYNAVGKAETDRTQVDKIKAWSKELTAHHKPQDDLCWSAKQLAEYIVLSSIGLRDQARNERQLRILLDIQRSGLAALSI